MKKNLAKIFLITIFLTVFSFSAWANVQGEADLEWQMLDLINQERAAIGVKPLQMDARLVELARLKSRDMIDKSYFSHTSPTYGSPFQMMENYGVTYTTAGENLAGNPSLTGAHTSLMNSPGHKANILNPDFTHIGLGVVKGGQYGMMITQMFIKPNGSATILERPDSSGANEPETQQPGKPEPTPAPEKKPEPTPAPEKKPEPTPAPEKKPEPTPAPEKPEPTPTPEKRPAEPGQIITIEKPGAGLSKNKEIIVYLKDKRISFPDIKPFINESNRLLIPLRFLSENMGYQVDWESAEQKICIQNILKRIDLKINSKKILINDYSLESDSAPILYQNRTMVPLRLILEIFGNGITWIPDLNEVHIQ